MNEKSVLLLLLVNGTGIRNVIHTSNNMLFMFLLLRHFVRSSFSIFPRFIFLYFIFLFSFFVGIIARLNLKERIESTMKDFYI